MQTSTKELITNKKKNRNTTNARDDERKNSHYRYEKCHFMKLIIIFNGCRHFLDNNNNIQIDAVGTKHIENWFQDNVAVCGVSDQ